MSEYEHTEHLLEEIDQLRTTNRQLREYAEEQKQHIKRLEEAGDRMRLYCADPDDCFAWDKARKDNP